MSREHFQDIDQFAGSLRAADGRYLQTGHFVAPWWVDQNEFGRVAIQEVQVGAASVFLGVAPVASFSISLPVHLFGEARLDGQPISPDGYIITGAGHAMTVAVSGPNCWFTLTVASTDSLDEATQASFARSLTFKNTAASIACKPVGDLRTMARSLISLQPPLTPAVLQHVESELLDALAALSQAGENIQGFRGRQRFNRPRLIARSFEYWRSQEGQSVSITDLCSNLGVTDRTLRNAFYDYFGVAPIRLLKLRQLHEINRKLLSASPREETVSAVAAGFGIWDFAQFARQYRTIFLERPSETLRRSAPFSNRPQTFSQPWIAFALSCIDDRA